MVKVCVVVLHGFIEGDVERREKFWNNLNISNDRVGKGYRLCVLGDLNGWVGDWTRVGITGAFGVAGENDKEGG